MATLSTAPGSNALLTCLPIREREQFLASCEPFELQPGAVLGAVDTPYRHAYFPASGLIALLSVLHDHRPLELALIGREGVLGATLVLGIDTAPVHAVVHTPGIALRITVGRLQQRARASQTLRHILNRYLYQQLIELSLIAGCVGFHRVEQRLARTLLLADDRERDGHLYLTHGQLADTLGVRRSSVTIAARGLQDRGLIRYTRGSIALLDRAALEAASCECYQLLRAHQNR